MIINGKHENNWIDIDPGFQSELIDKLAEPFIDSFFKSMRSKGASVAIENLLSSNPHIDIENPAAINLKRRFISIHETSGRFMGYRLLKKRFLEDDLGVYSYLVKYEKNFFRFIYTFYNNGSSIRLYKFLLDDNIDAELEKSIRVHTE
ncbi:MAG: hypothetical protein ABIR18_01760 [Chitinophagaceae bacterium]